MPEAEQHRKETSVGGVHGHEAEPEAPTLQRWIDRFRAPPPEYARWADAQPFAPARGAPANPRAAPPPAVGG